MSVFPVFVDSRPAYFGDADGTLLHMPLGTGTVLSYLQECVSLAEADEPRILAVSESDDRCATDAQAETGGAEAVHAVGQLRELLDHCEPSDWLLFMDPVQFPSSGYRLGELLREAEDPRAVTYLVAAQEDSERTQEHVLVDSSGCVRRIQRYYAGVTCVSSCAVSCLLMSAAVARVAADCRFTSLGELRQSLTVRGIPGRDVFLAGGTIDLGQERGFLELSERILLGLAARGQPGSSGGAADSVLRGSGCRIHPTARLYGPVILQEGVALEAGAAVIGPALLGAGCCVEQNSVVAQCVVAPGATVRAKTTVRCRIVSGEAGDEGLSSGSDEGVRMWTRGGRFTTGTGASISSARQGRLRRAYPVVKRLVDVMVASAALLVLSPLLLMTAVLVKLSSRGPVLFAHGREGRDGREFRCWKFRTMIRGAHAQQRALYGQNLVDGPQFKLTQDPRITRVGDWLRTANIDELPQLINVVLGHMSLIGPRPSPFRENQICVPWRQARLSVRPGITGLWQLCRNRRSVGDFHQWIYYDMLYVRHLSAALDLKILLATLLTLGGRWSVALRWLIPAHRLQGVDTPTLPTRIPILSEAADLAVADPVAPLEC